MSSTRHAPQRQCWDGVARPSRTVTVGGSVSTRRSSRTVLFLTSTLLLSSLHARGQMVAEYMRPESPNWSSSRTIAGLVALAFSVPLFLAVIALLFARRHTYPIAGRGAWFLLGLNVWAMIMVTIGLIAFIVYPDGLPCAMHVIICFIPSPFILIWLVRAWLLVFRLEIMNYLTELAWRQSRIDQIKEKREKDKANAASSVSNANITAATVAATTGSNRPSHLKSSPVAPPSLQPLPSLSSLAPIGGAWFAQNRRFMGWSWIVGGISSITGLMLFLMLLTAQFDHDIVFMNEWRVRQGLQKDFELKSYWSHGAFFEAPRCFWYSIKLIMYVVSVGVGCPFGLFSGYRVWLSTKRMQIRAKEQEEFARSMGVQALQLHRVTSPSSSPRPPSSFGSSSSASGGGSSGGGGRGGELDELFAVKVEMCVTVLVGCLCTFGTFLLTAFAAEYVNLPFVVSFLVLPLVSGVEPLLRSFELAHKQAEVFRKGRERGVSGIGGTLAAHAASGKLRKRRGGQRGNLFIANVPHHRPLYRLEHVLKDSHCYPLLLKFLQKEYSSENALFYRMADDFGQFCNRIESILPNWFVPSYEEEHEDTVSRFNGSGGRSNTNSSAPMRRRHSLDYLSTRRQQFIFSPSTSASNKPPIPMHQNMFTDASSSSMPSNSSTTTNSTSSVSSSVVSSVRTVLLRERAAAYAAADKRLLARHNLRSDVPSPLPSSPLSVRRSLPPSPNTPLRLARNGTSITAPIMQRQFRFSHSLSPSADQQQSQQQPSQQQAPSSLTGPSLNVPAMATTIPTALQVPVPLRKQVPMALLSRLDRDGSNEHMQQQQLQQLQQHGQVAITVTAPTTPSPTTTDQQDTPTSAAMSPTMLSTTPRLGPASPMSLLTLASPTAAAVQPPRPPLVGRRASAGLAASGSAPTLTCRQMHQMASRARTWSLRIYNDFIKHNSVYQINIDNDLAKMITAKVQRLERWQPTPLDEVGQPDFERAALESSPPLPPPFPLSSLYKRTALSVFNLMERDSFRRFLLTADFQHLLQRADDAEADRLQHAAAVAPPLADSDALAIPSRADTAAPNNVDSDKVTTVPEDTAGEQDKPVPVPADRTRKSKRSRGAGSDVLQDRLVIAGLQLQAATQPQNTSAEIETEAASEDS